MAAHARFDRKHCQIMFDMKKFGHSDHKSPNLQISKSPPPDTFGINRDFPCERKKLLSEMRYFRTYLVHSEEITSDFTRPDDPLVRRIADYIAGMTDLFALRTAESLGHQP